MSSVFCADAPLRTFSLSFHVREYLNTVEQISLFFVSRQHELWPQQLTAMIENFFTPINPVLSQLMETEFVWFSFKLFFFSEVCLKASRQSDEGAADNFSSVRRQRCSSSIFMDTFLMQHLKCRLHST